MSKPKQFAVLCVILLLVETISLGITFTWYHYRNINSYQFLDKFLLIRYLVSPFIFDNPAREPTGVDYIGPRERRRSEAKWFISDAMFGWRQAPGVSILKQPNRVSSPVGWKMTNAQGFPAAGRYDYFYKKPKPQGVYRIVVMGGSHVAGDGAETPLDNLPSNIFFALKKSEPSVLPAGYDRIEVINAGVGGFSSAQQILYLLSELIPYEPDLVISYGGAVDFIVGRILFDKSGIVDSGFDYRKRAENSARLDQSYTFKGSLLLFAENIVDQVKMIVDEFATAYVVSKGWQILSGMIQPGGKLGANTDVTEADDSAYVAAALKTYERNVLHISALAKIYGFRVAFVLEPIMPTSGKVRTPFEEEVYAGLSNRELKARAKYYDGARKVFGTLGTQFPDRGKVCFIDVSRAFAAAAERVYEDSTHVLSAGNRLIAAQIKQQLDVCGAIRGAEKPG